MINDPDRKDIPAEKQEKGDVLNHNPGEQSIEQVAEIMEEAAGKSREAREHLGNAASRREHGDT